jgi:hypothetical protein
MRLHKTDRRFKLYQHGFTCYLEFSNSDWKNYNRYIRYCREKFGDEFWDFAGRIFQQGNWIGQYSYRNRGVSSKRIYLRGEKYYTLLLLVLPAEDEHTVYL